MEQLLKGLKSIESKAEGLGKTMKEESAVYSAELEERLRLGLQGEEAVKHYNEWMKRNGMEYLMVKE